jgi:hypothetical protein
MGLKDKTISYIWELLVAQEVIVELYLYPPQVLDWDLRFSRHM